MKRLIAALAAAALIPFAAMADDDARPKFGLAGVLSAKNKDDPPPIMLSAGEP